MNQSTSEFFTYKKNNPQVVIPSPYGKWFFDLTRNTATVMEIIGPNFKYFSLSCYKDPSCKWTSKDSINECCEEGRCACPK